uniref:Uncharacterized protein LOC102808319 n=1 Tax=Saccoglossus kowalevskii TaxID=10224 RepID=A0ABM0LUU1_SACKO|nr:PREDICTED: uncharacterized protein LOC102808319 [Saccoglossus kowalevskii]
MASVKVAVRVRPLFPREKQQDASFIVQINESTIALTNPKIPEHVADWDKNRERVRYFMYDYAYLSVNPKSPDYASQELIFQDLGTEILDAAFEGYNACLFAYGQTGSGKSYTMMGGKPRELGLIPRICEGLCSRVDDFLEEGITFKTEVSFLEIYNERVRDLLHARRKHTYTLKVREHPKEGPYVQDLSWHNVPDLAAVQNLIDKGNANRTTAATQMHDASSRSHAIFTLNFTQAKLEDNLPSEIVSKINLVDLAGSEKADPRYSKGRLMEGASINKSLVTLGNVISALAETSLSASVSVESFSSFGNSDEDASPRNTGRRKNTYIPYRNSVLTWLLKDSLGGNAKTIMIATISPASQCYSETLSTLRYAQRAKHIVNKPVINEDGNVTLIRELRAEIDKLKAMLEQANMRGSQMSLLSDASIFETLHKNEEQVELLTSAWVDKWRETAAIMQECNVGFRRNNIGVIVESQLPHLIGMDDDLLSTGIIIYHLKEGETRIGREDARTTQDIVLRGPALDDEHCIIVNDNGVVTLFPRANSLCAVNGNDVNSPTKLAQGAVILLGKTNMFRFNHPAQAAKLRERRSSSLFTIKKSPDLPPPVKVSSPTDDCLHAAVLDSSLSRNISSSESSLGQDDIADPVAPCRSPVSPIMMFNPQLEIEMQQKAETDRLEQTRKKLVDLKKEQKKVEEVHAQRQEEMEKSRQQWYDEIERQKQRLDIIREESVEAKLKHEKELEEMKMNLEKEKDEGTRRLSQELDNLKDIMSGKKTATAVETQTDILLSHVLETAQVNVKELDSKEVGMKRIANIELLQKRSQKKAEERIKRKSTKFEKQEKANSERIKLVENHLRAIESAENVHKRKPHRQHLSPADIDCRMGSKRSRNINNHRKAMTDKEESMASKHGAKPKRLVYPHESTSKTNQNNSDSSLSNGSVFSRLYSSPQGTKFNFLHRKNVEYGQVISWNKPDRGHYTERGYLARKSREDGTISRQIFPLGNRPSEFNNKNKGHVRPSRGSGCASSAWSKKQLVRLKGVELSFSTTDIACQTPVTELVDKAIQRSRSLSPTLFTKDSGVDAMPGFVSIDAQTEPDENVSKKTYHEPSSPLKRSRNSFPLEKQKHFQKRKPKKTSEVLKPLTKIKARITKRKPHKQMTRNATTSGSDIEVDWHLTNEQRQRFLSESESSSSPRRGHSLEDLGLPFEGFQQRPRGFYESVDSVFDEIHSSQSTDPYPCDSLQGDDRFLDELSEEEPDSLEEDVNEPLSKRSRYFTFKHVEDPYRFTNIDGAPFSPPRYELCESVDSAVGLMGTHEFEATRFNIGSSLDEAEILMYRDKDGNIKVGDPRFNIPVNTVGNLPSHIHPRSEMSADSIEANDNISDDSCNTSPRDKITNESSLSENTVKPMNRMLFANQNQTAMSVVDNRIETPHESAEDSRIFVSIPIVDDRNSSKSHKKGVRPLAETISRRTSKVHSLSKTSQSYPKQCVEHRADIVSTTTSKLETGSIGDTSPTESVGKQRELKYAGLVSAKMTGSRCTIAEGIYIPRGKGDVRSLDSEVTFGDTEVLADMISDNSIQTEVSQLLPGFSSCAPHHIEENMSPISTENRNIPTIVNTDISSIEDDMKTHTAADSPENSLQTLPQFVSEQIEDSEHEQSVSSTMDTDTSVETVIYRSPAETDDGLIDAFDRQDLSINDSVAVPDGDVMKKCSFEIAKDKTEPDISSLNTSEDTTDTHYVIQSNEIQTISFSEEYSLQAVSGPGDENTDLESKQQFDNSVSDYANVAPVNNVTDCLDQAISKTLPVPGLTSEVGHLDGAQLEYSLNANYSCKFETSMADSDNTISLNTNQYNVSNMKSTVFDVTPSVELVQNVDDLASGIEDVSHFVKDTVLTNNTEESSLCHAEDVTAMNNLSGTELFDSSFSNKRHWKLEMESLKSDSSGPNTSAETGLTPPKKKKVDVDAASNLEDLTISELVKNNIVDNMHVKSSSDAVANGSSALQVNHGTVSQAHSIATSVLVKSEDAEPKLREHKQGYISQTQNELINTDLDQAVQQMSVNQLESETVRSIEMVNSEGKATHTSDVKHKQVGRRVARAKYLTASSIKTGTSQTDPTDCDESSMLYEKMVHTIEDVSPCEVEYVGVKEDIDSSDDDNSSVSVDSLTSSTDTGSYVVGDMLDDRLAILEEESDEYSDSVSGENKGAESDSTSQPSSHDTDDTEELNSTIEGDEIIIHIAHEPDQIESESPAFVVAEIQSHPMQALSDDSYVKHLDNPGAANSESNKCVATCKDVILSVPSPEDNIAEKYDVASLPHHVKENITLHHNLNSENEEDVDASFIQKPANAISTLPGIISTPNDLHAHHLQTYPEYKEGTFSMVKVPDIACGDVDDNVPKGKENTAMTFETEHPDRIIEYSSTLPSGKVCVVGVPGVNRNAEQEIIISTEDQLNLPQLTLQSTTLPFAKVETTIPNHEADQFAVTGKCELYQAIVGNLENDHSTSAVESSTTLVPHKLKLVNAEVLSQISKFEKQDSVDITRHSKHLQAETKDETDILVADQDVYQVTVSDTTCYPADQHLVCQNENHQQPHQSDIGTLGLAPNDASLHERNDNNVSPEIKELLTKQLQKDGSSPNVEFPGNLHECPSSYVAEEFPTLLSGEPQPNIFVSRNPVTEKTPLSVESTVDVDVTSAEKAVACINAAVKPTDPVVDDISETVQFDQTKMSNQENKLSLQAMDLNTMSQSNIQKKIFDHIFNTDFDIECSMNNGTQNADQISSTDIYDELDTADGDDGHMSDDQLVADDNQVEKMSKHITSENTSIHHTAHDIADPQTISAEDMSVTCSILNNTTEPNKTPKPFQGVPAFLESTQTELCSGQILHPFIETVQSCDEPSDKSPSAFDHQDSEREMNRSSEFDARLAIDGVSVLKEASSFPRTETEDCGMKSNIYTEHQRHVSSNETKGLSVDVLEYEEKVIEMRNKNPHQMIKRPDTLDLSQTNLSLDCLPMYEKRSRPVTNSLSPTEEKTKNDKQCQSPKLQEKLAEACEEEDVIFEGEISGKGDKMGPGHQPADAGAGKGHTGKQKDESDMTGDSGKQLSPRSRRDAAKLNQEDTGCMDGEESGGYRGFGGDAEAPSHGIRDNQYSFAQERIIEEGQTSSITHKTNKNKLIHTISSEQQHVTHVEMTASVISKSVAVEIHPAALVSQVTLGRRATVTRELQERLITRTTEQVKKKFTIKSPAGSPSVTQRAFAFPTAKTEIREMSKSADTLYCPSVHYMQHEPSYGSVESLRVIGQTGMFSSMKNEFAQQKAKSEEQFPSEVKVSELCGIDAEDKSVDYNQPTQIPTDSLEDNDQEMLNKIKMSHADIAKEHERDGGLDAGICSDTMAEDGSYIKESKHEHDILRHHNDQTQCEDPSIIISCFDTPLVEEYHTEKRNDPTIVSTPMGVHNKIKPESLQYVKEGFDKEDEISYTKRPLDTGEVTHTLEEPQYIESMDLPTHKDKTLNHEDDITVCTVSSGKSGVKLSQGDEVKLTQDVLPECLKDHLSMELITEHSSDSLYGTDITSQDTFSSNVREERMKYLEYHEDISHCNEEQNPSVSQINVIATTPYVGDVERVDIPNNESIFPYESDQHNDIEFTSKDDQYVSDEEVAPLTPRTGKIIILEEIPSEDVDMEVEHIMRNEPSLDMAPQTGLRESEMSTSPIIILSEPGDTLDIPTMSSISGDVLMSEHSPSSTCSHQGSLEAMIIQNPQDNRIVSMEDQYFVTQTEPLRSDLFTQEADHELSAGTEIGTITHPIPLDQQILTSTSLVSHDELLMGIKSHAETSNVIEDSKMISRVPSFIFLEGETSRKKKRTESTNALQKKPNKSNPTKATPTSRKSKKLLSETEVFPTGSDSKREPAERMTDPGFDNDEQKDSDDTIKEVIIPSDDNVKPTETAGSAEMDGQINVVFAPSMAVEYPADEQRYRYRDDAIKDAIIASDDKITPAVRTSQSAEIDGQMDVVIDEDNPTMTQEFAGMNGQINVVIAPSMKLDSLADEQNDSDDAIKDAVILSENEIKPALTPESAEMDSQIDVSSVPLLTIEYSADAKKDSDDEVKDTIISSDDKITPTPTPESAELHKQMNFANAPSMTVADEIVGQMDVDIAPTITVEYPADEQKDSDDAVKDAVIASEDEIKPTLTPESGETDGQINVVLAPSMTREYPADEQKYSDDAIKDAVIASEDEIKSTLTPESADTDMQMDDEIAPSMTIEYSS